MRQHPWRSVHIVRVEGRKRTPVLSHAMLDNRGTEARAHRTMAGLPPFSEPSDLTSDGAACPIRHAGRSAQVGTGSRSIIGFRKCDLGPAAQGRHVEPVPDPTRKWLRNAGADRPRTSRSLPASGIVHRDFGDPVLIIREAPAVRIGMRERSDFLEHHALTVAAESPTNDEQERSAAPVVAAPHDRAAPMDRRRLGRHDLRAHAWRDAVGDDARSAPAPPRCAVGTLDRRGDAAMLILSVAGPTVPSRTAPGPARSMRLACQQHVKLAAMNRIYCGQC